MVEGKDDKTDTGVTDGAAADTRSYRTSYPSLISRTSRLIPQGLKGPTIRFGDILRLCRQNLWRRKSRTILTVLGVIVGCCSIVLMVSFGPRH